MKGNRKKLKLAATAAALLGLIAVVAVPVLRPKPLKVEAERAARGALRVTVDAEGRTRVRDLFRVTAPVTGLLVGWRLRRLDLVAVLKTRE